MTKKIMVVEDDEKISFLLNFLLTREDYAVIRAEDGKKASNLIASLSAPDLVLLDIMLPYKDGHELLKEIRKNNQWKGVPVIMLTAKSQSQDITKALNNGANEYLTKPFQPDELITRVKKIIRD